MSIAPRTQQPPTPTTTEGSRAHNYTVHETNSHLDQISHSLVSLMSPSFSAVREETVINTRGMEMMARRRTLAELFELFQSSRLRLPAGRSTSGNPGDAASFLAPEDCMDGRGRPSSAKVGQGRGLAQEPWHDTKKLSGRRHFMGGLAGRPTPTANQRWEATEYKY